MSLQSSSVLVVPEIHIDTVFKIIEFLSIPQAMSVLRVCKSWYELDRFEILWKTLLSNFILEKIHHYRSLSNNFSNNEKGTTKGNSKDANDLQRKKLISSYKALISHLEKFHTTQILKEKSVNRAGFEKYMEETEEEATSTTLSHNNERHMKSTVFGMRFKKLASSALIMHFNLIMNKGAEELRENASSTILDYRMPRTEAGGMASYFLEQARKFTSGGRITDSVYAVEYWKRYSNVISSCVFELLKSTAETGRHFTKYLENFKPIFNKDFLMSAINASNDNDYILDSLLNYISEEGNFEKSDDQTMIDIRYLALNAHMKRLQYLKKYFSILYPSQWLSNFKKCLDERYPLDYFVVRSNRSAQQSFKDLQAYLEIFEIDSIDFTKMKLSNLLTDRKEDEMIELLGEHGLLTENDYKIIFHSFNYTSKMSCLLPKIIKQQGNHFDPYEVMETSRGKCNFVLNFLTTHCMCSISSTFEQFFKEYHEGKFDLMIPINRVGINNNNSSGSTTVEDVFNNYYRKQLNARVLDHFLGHFINSEDIIPSLDILIHKFTPSIDVTCIEEIANYYAKMFMNGTAYKGVVDQHSIDGFRYAIQHIPTTTHNNGVPFEEYCIRDIPLSKYEDCGLSTLYKIYTPAGEERMAYLYYLSQHILEEMTKYLKI